MGLAVASEHATAATTAAAAVAGRATATVMHTPLGHGPAAWAFLAFLSAVKHCVMAAEPAGW